jgi:hypothetical protein
VSAIAVLLLPFLIGIATVYLKDFKLSSVTGGSGSSKKRRPNIRREDSDDDDE